MIDIDELYQSVIMDHGRRPKNFYPMEHASHEKEGFNPMCGDQYTVYLDEKEGVIERISFTGKGCAISMASASLMTESLVGKKESEIKEIFSLFQNLVKGNELTEEEREKLGKLIALEGVANYPTRTKCATLAWHTCLASIAKSEEEVQL